MKGFLTKYDADRFVNGVLALTQTFFFVLAAACGWLVLMSWLFNW